MKKEDFMKKFQIVLAIACVTLLVYTSCAGKPGTVNSGLEGQIIARNQSGVELVIYVNTEYKDTVKTGETVTFSVYNVDSVGTNFDVEVFFRDRLSNLRVYPSNPDARYFSFSKTVRPLGHPDPIRPIVIPRLSELDIANNVGINSVLVTFSYNDYPRIDSTVSVFTGSTVNQNPIIRLQNGDNPQEVPMPIGLNPISVEYAVSGRIIQRKAYPQNENQRNDERFIVYVPSDITEASKVIPMISDIFNISYSQNRPEARGTLRVSNNSSRQISVLVQSGTESERPINGADSVVLRNLRRDFPINSGNYFLRVVDALSGGYTEIARIDDIIVEPGMVYYWFIGDQGSTQNTTVNMAVSQQIKNWFQTWIIDSIDGAKISLRIVSTANEVQNSSRELGTTGRNGQLVLRDIDIENMIRGLTTDNARRVNLTIKAEKDGYEPASQSLSAYSLLTAGTTFRPERFGLERINTSIENAEIIIGDPIIP
jgi:hypothetical protein